MRKRRGEEGDIPPEKSSGNFSPPYPFFKIPECHLPSALVFQQSIRLSKMAKCEKIVQCYFRITWKYLEELDGTREKPLPAATHTLLSSDNKQ